MATIVKAEQLVGTGLIKTVNTDYIASLSIFVEDCTPSSALQEAITLIETLGGYTVGSKPTTGQFANLDLEVTAIEAYAKSDTKVEVLVRFGMPQVPLTTSDDPVIKWVYETHMATRQIQSALAYDAGGTQKIPIKARYRPLISGTYSAAPVYMSNTDAGAKYMARRLERAVTATKYMPWTTAICRARIHKSWDEQISLGIYNSTKLQVLLEDTYNYETVATDGSGKTMKARQWMCMGVDVTTPNQGLIHNVEVTLVHNPFGWDPYIFYVDPLWNAIPAEVYDALLDPANADLLTVDHETLTEPVGAAGTTPWGIKRPYMAKKFMYGQVPIGIDLFKITGS